MPTLDSPLPVRRRDLIVRSVGKDQYVVKHPGTGAYFRIGMIEHFLLLGLDGNKTADELRSAFRTEFGDDLSEADLEEFIEIVRSRNLLLEPSGGSATPSTSVPSPSSDVDDEEDNFEPFAGKKQSFLYWRKSLWDPDRFLTRLAPRLTFLWTPAFVACSSAVIVCGFLVALANSRDMVSAAPNAARWETAIIGWCTVILATMLHECAHGLTCKHFGGEVREIGVLFVFFTPCLYCNVSDAWLMPEKSRRLWITLAGSYADLCIAALAVFVWRLTVPHTMPNYVAWVIATVCGTRILFNFNPLSRLDGYYLLCDWLDVPNLRPRAAAYWMENVRWLLWGAPRPPKVHRGWLLIGYGLTIWLFAVVFLNVVILNFCHWIGQRLWGAILATLLTTMVSKRVFKGFFASEFMKMLTTRHLRTAFWCVALIGIPTLSFAIPMRSTASGSFTIRPGVRSEVHAPIAGFLDKVLVEEGDLCEKDRPLAQLRINDMESLIARKKAEIRESEANLARLRTGNRPEQISEQKARVARAESWRDMAQKDLDRARKALELDLLRMDLEIKQADTELEFSRGSLALAIKLYEQGALAGESLRAERKKQSLLESQRAQAVARRQSRESAGIEAAQEDLVRREKEVAEANAALHLLEAGSRPEDIEAEKARRSRLQEELDYLNEQQSQLLVEAPVAGVVATPRLHDKVGEHLEKGALICLLEDVSTLQVEIIIPEEDLHGVRPGQVVELKARSLPFETFTAEVERIAPAAAPVSGNGAEIARGQSAVMVYCRVDNKDGKLKSGMTGVARIQRGRKSIGSTMVDRGLKYLRTEFWW